MKIKIAVLIPCLNEEATVGKVVTDFKRELPESVIFVFDNGSTDRTAQVAKEAGAEVRTVNRKGKGNVVTDMFRVIDADYYLMVDGDDTYPANKARCLLNPVLDGECDMVVGKRVAENARKAFRKFHRLGNHIVAKTINIAFDSNLRDIFSGFRAFNRKLVTSLPLLSKGFEIEAEFTLQALDKGFLISEIDLPYKERPQGSFSKLSTYADGLLVLKTIAFIIKDYKPLAFFSVISLLSFLVSLGLGSFVIKEFLNTQKVFHPSTAVLASALMIIAIISLIAGLILDSTKRHYSESRTLILNQFYYLRQLMEGQPHGQDYGDLPKRNIS